MANKGIYPLDPNTQVGRFRLRFGDIDSVPLDPVEPGFQDYTELSDEEIEAFLNGAGDSVSRAIGAYYAQLAGAAAKIARNTKDHDLALNTMERSERLLAVARYWDGVADNEDTEAGSTDIFEIFPTGPTVRRTPELAMGVWDGI